MPDVTCTTAIDWAATGTMLQGIGSIGGAIVVLVAAKIGASTFESWRQQKLSERLIEQAERILTATYNGRRDLSYIRSPMMWSHETDAAEEQLKENGQWDKAFGDPEKKKLATAQAYYNRLNRTVDTQKTLEECQPMARALFSEELEKAIEKLNHQFHTFRVYVDANHRDKDEADKDFRRKIESTIWESYPSREENEVDKIIAEQVKFIEDTCVPVLRLKTQKNRGGALQPRPSKLV